MISIAPILTSAGQDMLIRALAGETLTFTTFKAGSGVLPAGSTGVDLTDLITPKFSFAISALEEGTNCVRINGHFDSQDILQEFACTEIGLFAKIGNESAKLYGYVNNGTNAPIFKPNDSDVITTQDITFIVAVGAAQNVAAEIAPGTLYALREHTHSVADLTGTIPVTNGGTGVNSANALTALIREAALTNTYVDPADCDCNDMIAPGIYYGDTNTANGPNAGASRDFFVFVVKAGRTMRQILFATQYDLNGDMRIYTRAGTLSVDGTYVNWATWNAPSD